MTPSQEQRSQLLKTRTARQLAWINLASGLAEIDLTAQRITHEQHERVVDAFRSFDPVARLARSEDWPSQARSLAQQEFSILIGDPWDVHLQPIARVAGPALAEKLADIAKLFPSGFFLADAAASRFVIVDFDEDSDSGEIVAQSAVLER